MLNIQIIFGSNLKKKFNLVSDFHAPVRLRKAKSLYAPWLTTQLREEMHRRDYLKRGEVETNSSRYHGANKIKRHYVNKLVRDTKAKHCEINIDKNKHNPKEMWKKINQVLSGKSRCSKTTNISKLKTKNNGILSDELDMANRFNAYFTEKW